MHICNAHETDLIRNGNWDRRVKRKEEEAEMRRHSQGDGIRSAQPNVFSWPLHSDCLAMATHRTARLVRKENKCFEWRREHKKPSHV